MPDVRINIDLSNGVIDIEGDSDFVEKQLARFESEIKQQLSRIAPLSKQVSPLSKESGINNSSNDKKIEDKNESYDDVFEIHDDKTHIVKDIPGSSLKEKIVAVSLLLAFGESLRGNDSALVEDVRNECIRHGCMDTKNFARYTKSYNTLMIDSGSGKSATLKLTQPGSKTSVDLIERVRSNEIGDFFKSLASKPKAKTKKSNPKESLAERKSEKANSSKSSKSRPGPGEIIKRLAEDGFFDESKTIDKIIEYCKESLAFTYKVTELSSSLTRATRSNLLKRSKGGNGQYEYTSAK